MERTEEGRDLIETLWNVKTEAYKEVAAQLLGFNRDIVECKEHQRAAGHQRAAI